MRYILYFFALLAVIGTSSLYPQEYPGRTYNLRPAAPEGTLNMLKPSSIVVDSWRGMAYVGSDVSRSIAVIDLIQDEQKQSIPLPEEQALPFKLLAYQSDLHRVILADRAKRGAGRKIVLRAIDVTSENVSARRDLGWGTRVQVIPDPVRDRCYVSTGRNHILILNERTLEPVDSLDVGAPCGGMAFDSSYGELYVMEAERTGITVFMKKYSVLNNQLLSTVNIPAQQPLDRLAYHIELMRVIAFGNNDVVLLDEFGTVLFQERYESGIGDYAVSQISERLYFLDVRGETDPPGGGRHGILRAFGFRDFDVAETDVGVDPEGIAVYDDSFEVLIALSGTADVSNYDTRSLGPTSGFDLGESVDALALSSDGSKIVVANALGEGDRLSFIDIASGESETARTGMYPTALAPAASPPSAVALSHFDGRAYKHRVSDGSFEWDSEVVAHGNSDQYPAFVEDPENPGIAMALFPEHGQRAFVDLNNGETRYKNFVESYFGLGGEGHGLLQGAFIPGTDWYCILLYRGRLLNLYHRSDHRLLNQITLANADWDALEPFGRMALRAGPSPKTIMLGPHLLEVQSIDLRGEFLPANSVYLGNVNAWTDAALGWRDSTLQLQLIDPEIGAIVQTLPLRPGVHTPPGTMYYDITRAMLALGYPQEPAVFLLDLRSVTGIAPQPPAPDEHTLEVYPSPVSLSRHTEALLRGKDLDESSIAVYTLLGQKLDITVRTSSAAAALQIGGFVPGLYIVRQATGGIQRSALLHIHP